MADTVDLTKRLPRGAIPSPRHELAAAMPHVPDPAIAVPPSFLMWPAQMSSWNNYVYGDCVTAEEAFAKATAAPQTFIPLNTVVAWATAHGVLNGASLTGVLTTMQTDGFPLNNHKYNDGPYNSVNWANASILQSAIYSHGPVKIGVGAGEFQSNPHGLVTPGTCGWAMYDYPTNEGEDHCTSLCGYGTLAELVALFKQHGVTVNVPAGMPTGLCYAMFTWNSIGIIDQQSMLNMTYEAWIRNPVTIVFIPIPGAAGTHLDGYQTTFNNQQHVNFIGPNNHVYELVYTDHWSQNDLTAAAGAPSVVPGSSLDGYQTEFNNQQHVNFIGPDNHVHELVYTNRWSHNDLTAAAGAPNVAPGSPLDGYETSFNKQQHVNFIGADNHIHELVYTDHWSHNDLTAAAGAPNVAPGSPLDGYQTEFNSQQHVNFIGADNHVHELVYTNRWSHNDLTAAAGAPNAAPGSSLDGYETSFNSQQHVNFIGTDGHVHELVFTNRWSHNDLTADTGAPNAAPGSALDGYQTTFNNQQHVNFIGADNHVHELVYTNRWSHNDLTAGAGAPNVATVSKLDGYQTSFNNQQHVNFIGADNHVYELVYTNRWSCNDLTMAYH